MHVNKDFLVGLCAWQIVCQKHVPQVTAMPVCCFGVACSLLMGSAMQCILATHLANKATDDCTVGEFVTANAMGEDHKWELCLGLSNWSMLHISMTLAQKRNSGMHVICMNKAIIESLVLLHISSKHGIAGIMLVLPGWQETQSYQIKAEKHSCRCAHHIRRYTLTSANSVHC